MAPSLPHGIAISLTAGRVTNNIGTGEDSTSNITPLISETVNKASVVKTYVYDMPLPLINLTKAS